MSALFFEALCQLECGAPVVGIVAIEVGLEGSERFGLASDAIEYPDSTREGLPVVGGELEGPIVRSDRGLGCVLPGGQVSQTRERVGLLGALLDDRSKQPARLVEIAALAYERASESELHILVVG